jgi:hypothetical protein
MRHSFRSICTVLALGLTIGTAAQTAPAAEPELVSVKKIWDQGKHNAFTDLIRWRGKWYCTFREADGHVGGDGKLRVLESPRGEVWRPVGLVQEKGIDLRDPKLSITPDDRLMIVAGGSVYRGKTLLGRQPRVTFSRDARTWTPPQRVLSEGEWLWRVTWHQGRAYGITYNAFARKTKEAQQAAKSHSPVSTDPADWKLKLVVSEDGIHYDIITHLGVPGHPNESTLRFLPDGELMALVRREGGDTFGWIGTSKPPYKKWTWHPTMHRFGGPNFLRLPDGSLWAVSRIYPGGAKTVLARLTRDSYQPVLTLPSGGDTSYAGLVWYNRLLWVSYYSSHEGKTRIYLAKIRVPMQPLDIGSRRELFVDDFLIDSLKGARQVLQKPTPHEVVLTADRPWEGNTSAYFTLFQDGDLYRMYYRGSHFNEKTKKAAHPEVTCYAESKDGIHWTKPDLGLFEFGGSKQNNIVWTGEGTHNMTPFRDSNPRCTPDARYKALARTRGGLLALKSADAIHWSLMSDKPVITKGAFDSQNLAFWDAEAGVYRDYHRAFRTVRDIMTCTSTDFLHWTPPAFLDYGDAPREHLYTNAIQPYARAPHLLLGFPTHFLPAKQQTEPTFMVSRDGKTFHRWTEAVIPRTAPKDRDGNRSNYMAWGVLSLPGKEKELSVYGTEAYYTGPGSRLRRFSYRVDGFVSVHAPAEGGELLTKPLRFKGEKLTLNFVTGPTGSVQVEVQDADGQPIKGLTLGDCKPLQGDQIEQVVTWKDGAGVGRLAGKPVRLRFRLKDADVFSVRFQ